MPSLHAPFASPPSRPTVAARPSLGRRDGARGWTAWRVARCVPVLLGVLASAACNRGVDPFAPRADRETVAIDLTLQPLSGSDRLLPSAVDLFVPRAVRPQLVAAYPNFDFAVDLAGGDAVRLVPAARVIAVPPELGAPPRVGFQVVSQSFDALESAPRGGYVYDSVTTVRVGQTIAIDAQGVVPGGPRCPSTASTLYAKLRVDSVSAATGAVYLRLRVNPNCGFRSLRSGLPTD